jgi:hypothetical protein
MAERDPDLAYPVEDLIRDPAYELLKTVSGQNFEPRDYEAWDRWFASQ